MWKRTRSCDRHGLLHLFMFLDAMMFIKKLIAMGRVVCSCEVRRNGEVCYSQCFRVRWV